MNGALETNGSSAPSQAAANAAGGTGRQGWRQDRTRKSYYIRTEDGACTWVCRAAAGTATNSGGSTCYDTFLQHGRSALLIDMALE